MAKFLLGIIACILAFYFLNGGTIHDLFSWFTSLGSHMADITVNKVKHG